MFGEKFGYTPLLCHPKPHQSQSAYVQSTANQSAGGTYCGSCAVGVATDTIAEAGRTGRVLRASNKTVL